MDNNNIINLEDQTEMFCVSFMTCLVANFGIWQVEDSWNARSIPGKFYMWNIVWKYVCGYVYEYLLLRKMCPYLRLFWFVFSRIPSEYGEMRENADQHYSEYGHFLHSVYETLFRRDIVTQSWFYVQHFKVFMVTSRIAYRINSWPEQTGFRTVF